MFEGFTWNMLHQLGAVRNVPQPQLAFRRFAYEVLAFVLFKKKPREAIEASHRITVRPSLDISARRALVLEDRAHAAFGALSAFSASLRRAWTSSAASAAGVTPDTRPAAASVGGEASLRRSTISFERPGT